MFKFIKDCFSVNLNEYENFNVNLEINKIVLCTFLVMVVGVVFLDLYRGSIRKVTSQLVRHKAKSEDSAMTLEELGLEKSRVVRYMLSHDNLLTKLVARRGERAYSYEEYRALSKEERREIGKIDFSTAAFYLKSGEEADKVSEFVDKYDTSVGRTVASCVFILVVMMCIVLCMPGILNLVDNLIGK